MILIAHLNERARLIETIHNYQLGNVNECKKVLPINLDSLLSSLKPRQLEALKHTQAPQLILAGAGTCKTAAITAKIAHMVENGGIDSSRILVFDQMAGSGISVECNL